MNIGPTEIIVVLVIALLVFGPSKLPQMGRTLGRGIREFKNAANTAKEELGLGEVIDDVNSVKDDVMSAAGVDEIKESIAGVTSTIDDVKKSAGVDEIAAGIGSVKTAMAFNPRMAAKELVRGGKPSSGEGQEAAKAEGTDAGAREPASPAAGTSPAGEDVMPAADDSAPTAEAGAPATDGGTQSAGDEPLAAEPAATEHADEVVGVAAATVEA